MSRIRLCSHLLAGISCWLFLSGCLSVDIETRAGRDLSGSRTYHITLEPMLARVYNAGVASKMFDFPGQDLEKHDGIVSISKTEAKKDDGSLELVWSYKAKRLRDFSEERDSLTYSKRYDKWWIYYNYYERCLPRDDTSRITGAGNARYKSRLLLPGQVISHDGDSLAGSAVVWVRPMDVAARAGLVMNASSREINPVYLVLALVTLCIAFYFALRKRIFENV
jgi:hypothetical protein